MTARSVSAIVADETRLGTMPVGERHRDLLGAVHDVTVRQNESVAGEQETGAAAAAAAVPPNFDCRDGRTHSLDRIDDGS